jgi:hypothetical protein
VGVHAGEERRRSAYGAGAKVDGDGGGDAGEKRWRHVGEGEEGWRGR